MQTDWREEAMARQREMAEQAATNERAYRSNVEIFTRMWLTLGSDVIKVADGSRHDQALAEAKSLAASRWNQLLSIEQQIVREEQLLAARPKTRPVQQGDDLLPDRTIDERNRQWLDEKKHRRGVLDGLKEQAKAERKELEALITTNRR
jgi:hypothetical protein